MRAVRVHEFGEAGVLGLEEIPLPDPGPGQVRVRAGTIGVNYADTLRRAGRTAASLALPWTPGSEVAGEIDAIGVDVEDISPGDRVASRSAVGAYAEYSLAAADSIVPLPPDVSYETAAAVLNQGMTAHALARDAVRLSAGDFALVHAAAGGVGLLLVQILVGLGVRVIGTVSSPEKEIAAKDAGAEAVVRYIETDFADEALRITSGEGVRTAFDSVGAPTVNGSLRALGVRGTLVIYGQAGGPPPLLDTQQMAPKGLTVTRFSVAHYARTRTETLDRARAVLEGPCSCAFAT